MSGEHDWDDGKRFGYQVCRKCCVVKRIDGKNKPCRPARLREMELGLVDEDGHITPVDTSVLNELMMMKPATASPPTDAGEQVKSLLEFAEWQRHTAKNHQLAKQLESAAATIERLTAERDAATMPIYSPPTDAGELVKELRWRASHAQRTDRLSDCMAFVAAAATIEQKDTEIKILVDLLKRGFEISNREGWEEGENKTEWQSIASDALATYDEKFRDSGLRSMESLVALERQQAATVERLTAELAEAKAERDAAVKVVERMRDTANDPHTYAPDIAEGSWMSLAFRLGKIASDFIAGREASSR